MLQPISSENQWGAEFMYIKFTFHLPFYVDRKYPPTSSSTYVTAVFVQFHYSFIAPSVERDL